MLSTSSRLSPCQASESVMGETDTTSIQYSNNGKLNTTFKNCSHYKVIYQHYVTGALNVTDSNCKTWPIASVKELQEREGILSLWRYFIVGFLQNIALFLLHKRLCGWTLSVQIEPEAIGISSLIQSVSKPSSRIVLACTPLPIHLQLMDVVQWMQGLKPAPDVLFQGAERFCYHSVSFIASLGYTGGSVRGSYPVLT